MGQLMACPISSLLQAQMRCPPMTSRVQRKMTTRRLSAPHRPSPHGARRRMCSCTQETWPLFSEVRDPRRSTSNSSAAASSASPPRAAGSSAPAPGPGRGGAGSWPRRCGRSASWTGVSRLSWSGIPWTSESSVVTTSRFGLLLFEKCSSTRTVRRRLTGRRRSLRAGRPLMATRRRRWTKRKKKMSLLRQRSVRRRSMACRRRTRRRKRRRRRTTTTG
mmetsp:Transcript_41953/g.110741  ORF Transcript_41953/g.110741 Transcript_41953/m.110741 type:complete len:219 (-) Transcript_41953:844-1500(-)